VQTDTTPFVVTSQPPPSSTVIESVQFCLYENVSFSYLMLWEHFLFHP